MEVFELIPMHSLESPACYWTRIWRKLLQNMQTPHIKVMTQDLLAVGHSANHSLRESFNDLAPCIVCQPIRWKSLLLCEMIIYSVTDPFLCPSAVVNSTDMYSWRCKTRYVCVLCNCGCRQQELHVFHLVNNLWLFLNYLIHWNSSAPAKQRGSMPGRAPWILLFAEVSCQWPYLPCQRWFMLAVTTLLRPQVHLHQSLVPRCWSRSWCELICPGPECRNN